MKMNVIGPAAAMMMLGAVGAPVDAGEPDVSSCAGCHAGPLDLGTRSTDELTAALSAMAAGERAHPTDLSALDAESIRELAAALTR